MALFYSGIELDVKSVNLWIRWKGTVNTPLTLRSCEAPSRGSLVGRKRWRGMSCEVGQGIGVLAETHLPAYVDHPTSPGSPCPLKKLVSVRWGPRQHQAIGSWQTLP